MRSRDEDVARPGTHTPGGNASWVRRTARGVLVLAVLCPTVVLADHHEAQWSARPFAGVAEMHESGGDARPAEIGGLSLTFSYGVSNDMDIGGELVGLATTAPRFMTTTIVDGGAPYTGPLTRRTDSALLLLGPTWRFGVSWVPVVTVAAGAGARYRSDGTLADKGLILDDKRATLALDLAATARVGIEHRLHPRVVVGAYAFALACWSPSTPFLPAAGVSLGISYVHYPLW